MSDFSRTLETFAPRVDAALRDRISALDAPARLKDAMVYAAAAGGKRVRPFLVMETARLLGAEDRAWETALALESIHCYSLAHDDLPAMDDDDMRRGRPSLHRAYDEATAILAGDALQTLAFELIAADPALSGEEKARMMAMLAQASGAGGMAGGQMIDLEAEGRFADGRPLQLEANAILHLQSLKTGALFRFACLAGALVGKASATEGNALAAYADALGRAFQISDDVLDVEGTTEAMGKTVGKDAAQGKGTLVSLWGLEGAKAKLAETLEEGQKALAAFEGRAETLAALLTFVGERRK